MEKVVEGEGGVGREVEEENKYQSLEVWLVDSRRSEMNNTQNMNVSKN